MITRYSARKDIRGNLKENSVTTNMIEHTLLPLERINYSLYAPMLCELELGISKGNNHYRICGIDPSRI